MRRGWTPALIRSCLGSLLERGTVVVQEDRIAELQALVEDLWRRAKLGPCVRIRRERADDGSPHVEVVGGRFDIVTTERGWESSRTRGLSVDEAARFFLFGMAEGHALTAELRDRRAPADAPPCAHGLRDDGYSRWNWMAPSIETMGRISPELGDWARQHYLDILRRAPLADNEIRNARHPCPSAD